MEGEPHRPDEKSSDEEECEEEKTIQLLLQNLGPFAIEKFTKTCDLADDLRFLEDSIAEKKNDIWKTCGNGGGGKESFERGLSELISLSRESDIISEELKKARGNLETMGDKYMTSDQLDTAKTIVARKTSKA